MIAVKNRVCCLAIAALIGLLAIGVDTLYAAQIHIGVLAKRGPERVIQRWSPLASHLSEKLGETIVVTPLSFSEIEPALANGRIHFLLTNSGFFVTLRDRYELKALSTMVNRYQNVALSQFGGVIISRQDSGVEFLEDLRGKRFMCVNFSSFGGGQMALRLLLDNGINPRKHCSAYLEGNTHDNVVYAVLSGKADAGTVRSDTLEKMRDEGKIRIDDLRVIHPIKDNFPLLHSTRLYPEWPFIACKPANRELRRQVTKQLRLLDADHPAMVAARVQSWNYPGDYNAVAECLKRVRKAR